MIFRNATIIQSDSSILKNYDIQVTDGKITNIAEHIDNINNDSETNLNSKIIFPGLINSHAHLGETLFRGYCDGLNLKEYLDISHDTYNHERIMKIADKLHELSSLVTLYELIHNGTTSVCCGRGWDQINAIGMRGICGFPIINIPKLKKFYHRLGSDKSNFKWENDRLTGIYFIQGLETIEEDMLKKLSHILRNDSRKFYIHVSETENEIKWCASKFKSTPIQYLHKLGLLSDKAVLVHSVYLSDEDLKLIETNQCSIVLCPTANLKLKDGIPRINDLLSLNIHIGLGTDGLATNNDSNLFDVAKLLLLLSDCNRVTIKRIIKILTSEAAAIFNMNTTGDVLIGNSADFIVLDAPHYILEDTKILTSNLLLNHSMFKVQSVFVNGVNILPSNDFVNSITEEFLFYKKVLIDSISNDRVI